MHGFFEITKPQCLPMDSISSQCQEQITANGPITANQDSKSSTIQIQAQIVSKANIDLSQGQSTETTNLLKDPATLSSKINGWTGGSQSNSEINAQTVNIDQKQTVHIAEVKLYQVESSTPKVSENSDSLGDKLWHMPLRNPNFTGRNTLLEQMAQHLKPSQSTTVACQTLVLQAYHGLGGVGKTQLAIEYAYRYAHNYDHIFWCSAEK